MGHLPFIFLRGPIFLPAAPSRKRQWLVAGQRRRRLPNLRPGPANAAELQHLPLICGGLACLIGAPRRVRDMLIPIAVSGTISVVRRSDRGTNRRRRTEF